MPTSAILYRSTESPDLSAGDLLELIQNAKASNAKRRITGLLLHGQMTYLPNVPGGFVQWIEGEDAEVRDLFETIQKDERHTNVEALAEGTVQSLAGTHRLFPFWSMQMLSLAELPATLPGFLRFVSASKARWGTPSEAWGQMSQSMLGSSYPSSSTSTPPTRSATRL